LVYNYKAGRETDNGNGRFYGPADWNYNRTCYNCTTNWFGNPCSHIYIAEEEGANFALSETLLKKLEEVKECAKTENE
jgi:hypothetical protein